jgi:outer membrane protease
MRYSLAPGILPDDSKTTQKQKHIKMNATYLSNLKAEITALGGSFDSGINWDWASFPTRESAVKFCTEFGTRIIGLDWEQYGETLIHEGRSGKWSFRAR